MFERIERSRPSVMNAGTNRDRIDQAYFTN